MGNKEIIYDLLKENNSGLTVSEISEKINISKKAVRVYINRLEKCGLITKKTKKGRENLYVLRNNKKNLVYEPKKAVSYVKFLNNFFKQNLSYLMKDKNIINYILENEKIFNEIEEFLAGVE